MARLCLIAEGKTEQQFAAQLLVQHLASHGVYLTRPSLVVTSREKGKRGGVLKYDHVKIHIQRWLKQEHGNDVYFTTMFDMYRLPQSFPGYVRAVATKDKYARVEALEGAFADDLKDPRFIPYLQLHEFEAILFADPSALARYYTDAPGRDRKVQALGRLAEEFGNPELIDDGQQTAPSKRIIAQFPDYEDRKPTVGPIIAEAIGLEVIRSKCRHFNEWLTKLENLGIRR